MKDRISVEGRDGAFGAYIARPKAVPAPAVVVLQELFGVNADIRKTCDELAEQGFIAVAPDLFWRQEPGVDLDWREWWGHSWSHKKSFGPLKRGGRPPGAGKISRKRPAATGVPPFVHFRSKRFFR